MFARLLIASALIAAPAIAQDKSAPDNPPKRIRSILLYGDDKCPPSDNKDEIVVCANAGESPYRIPKRFREKADTSVPGSSWTRRMEVVEDFNSRTLPNSCSPVGSGGQTGCTTRMIQQWYQEKLDKEAKAAQTKQPDSSDN